MTGPFPDVGLEDWRRRVTEELDGESPETLGHSLLGGIEIHPLYTSEDLPAELPRLVRERRGARVCEIVEPPSPGGAGRQMSAAVRGGADAIWLRLDRAARLGLDFQPLHVAGRGGIAHRNVHLVAKAFGDAAFAGGQVSQPVPCVL